MQSTRWTKQLQKLDDIKKICKFKKGNRDQKSKNYANKLEIKEVVSKCYYNMKLNPKAFAIPILAVAIWMMW